MTEVAAAILRRDGKILICQRKEGGNCSLLWEFPGGKREAGETMEQCVVRECQEELGIVIRPKGLYAQEHYTYGTEPFSFAFFNAEIAEGEPENHVHRAMKWVRPAELLSEPFCPADEGIVRRLAKEGALLRAVHHVAIIVSDYEKSKAFYVDTLGLEVVRENYRADRGSAPDPAGSLRPAPFGVPGDRHPRGRRRIGTPRRRGGANPRGRLYRGFVHLFYGPGRPAAGAQAVCGARTKLSSWRNSLV